MSVPAISVGIPAHDNATTIGETIASLRGQTHESWECFISCDSDSRATYEVARTAIASDERFTLSNSTQNAGVAGNWNAVLDRATRPYFKLLCADDVLYPTALESQRTALMENPSATLCTGRRTVIGANGRIIQKDRGIKGTIGLLRLDDVIAMILKSGTNPFGEPSFALYRTEALKRAGGFSSTWQYTIDLASYVEVLKLGALVSVDETVGQFRVSPSSWSSTLAKQQNREMLNFLDYALSLSTADVGGVDLALGRARVVAKSLLRRVVSKVGSPTGRSK
ncbi:MAG: glycosyltransferase family 2 protein [Acidimicrobiales bacterium]